MTRFTKGWNVVSSPCNSGQFICFYLQGVFFLFVISDCEQEEEKSMQLLSAVGWLLYYFWRASLCEKNKNEFFDSVFLLKEHHQYSGKGWYVLTAVNGTVTLGSSWQSHSGVQRRKGSTCRWIIHLTVNLSPSPPLPFPPHPATFSSSWHVTLFGFGV